MKLASNLDKIGTIGLFLAALATPCCFPLFAFVFSAFGLGSTELFGGWTEYIFEGLVLISLIGFFISFRQHKNIFPFIIGLISGSIIFYSYNFSFNNVLIYSGMFGLLFATVLNFFINWKNKTACATCALVDGKTIELESTITCPKCGHKKKELMPTDACQFYYECENCKTVLKPKQGDCCVYCSYGTVKCPSKQTGKDCC
ncbi:MAG: MerC domain-containing protein [Bacteroidetes bacterium]|nr:MerC domain-containing protein [Bacteroidota bacterium]